eukprot:5147955-Prymnesium_polylepis.1
MQEAMTEEPVPNPPGDVADLLVEAATSAATAAAEAEAAASAAGMFNVAGLGVTASTAATATSAAEQVATAIEALQLRRSDAGIERAVTEAVADTLNEIELAGRALGSAWAGRREADVATAQAFDAAQEASKLLLMAAPNPPLER